MPLGIFCNFPRICPKPTKPLGSNGFPFDRLMTQKYQVVIDFGVASAFRVVDEGMILNDAAQDKTMLNYRETKFKNVIYRITGGDFSEYIRRIGGNLYDLLELKHYLVVSENYVFDIITAWEPEIAVVQV